MAINYMREKDRVFCAAEGWKALRQYYQYSREERKLICGSQFIFRSHMIGCLCFLINLLLICIVAAVPYAVMAWKLKTMEIVPKWEIVGYIILLWLAYAFFTVKIVLGGLKESLYKKWWKCPSCGRLLPKRYLMCHRKTINMNVEPINSCPFCNTVLPQTIAEAKTISKEKSENKRVPKKLYHWGINRTIFAYIVDPYDCNGELSDDGMDWVEKDTLPCIQSLFHFLIDDKEWYERNGIKARMSSVYTEKPAHTDVENAGKVLLKFQFPDEAFYLYADSADAQKLQKLIPTYHEENITITEL